MAAKTAPQVQTAPETGVIENATNAADQAANAVGYANVIKKLIASGVKRISDVRVKNLNFTEKDNYTMLSLTLASQIRGYVSKDNGDSYQDGLTSTLFTSLYAVTGALKEDEELGWMANALLQNPQALNLIFNGSTVTILQQDVKAGEEYVNPFTTKDDATVQVFDHDVIINHLIGFKLGKTGVKMSDKLADKMMGF